MSGRREVKVIITGDADKFAAAADKATAKAGNLGHVGEKLGHTFTKAGSIVGGEFGEILDKVGLSMDAFGEHGQHMGSKIMGIGGAVTGLGVLLEGMASKETAAMQQLNAAVQATGKGYDGFREDVEKAVKQGENFGHKASDTVEALRRLTQATQDPHKALERMALVEKVAAAQHISLSEAAGQIAKVYGGAGKMLKQYGVQLESAKTATAALTAAQHAHQAAVDRLAHAQQALHNIQLVQASGAGPSISQEIRLRDARERLARATGALNGAQGLTLSQQIRLRNAQEAVATAEARLTDKHANHAKAVEALQRATQRLNDVEALQAQGASSNRARLLDAVSAATQHLSDVQAVQASGSGQSVGKQIQLQNALQSVKNAQDHLRESSTKLAEAQKKAGGASQFADKALDQVSKRLAGQDKAAIDTFTGRLQVWKVKAEDAAASFGQKFGGAVTAAGPVMFGFGAILETGVIGKLGKLGGKIGEQVKGFAGLGKSVAIVAGTYTKLGITAAASAAKSAASWLLAKGAMLATAAAQKVMAAAQWLLNAAMDANPIGIAVVALAALAAGLIYAYHHSERFREIVQKAAHLVGAAFSGLWHGIEVVFDWAKTHWPLLAGILFGPFGFAVAEIVKHWHAVEGFFAAIPGKIRSITATMWDGIKDAFKGVINWIIGAWNSLHFSLPSIDTHIPGIGKIGGFDIGVPQIPKLAHGGVATATPGGRLVNVAEAGSDEAIIPLDRYFGRGHGGGDDRPIVVKLYLDGKEIHQSLLRRKRQTGAALGLG